MFPFCTGSSHWYAYSRLFPLLPKHEVNHLEVKTCGVQLQADLLLFMHITSACQNRPDMVVKLFVTLPMCVFHHFSLLAWITFLLLFASVRPIQLKLAKACNKYLLIQCLSSFSLFLITILVFCLPLLLTILCLDIVTQRVRQTFKSRNRVSKLLIFIAKYRRSCG